MSYKELNDNYLQNNLKLQNYGKRAVYESEELNFKIL